MFTASVQLIEQNQAFRHVAHTARSRVYTHFGDMPIKMRRKHHRTVYRQIYVYAM